MENIFRSILDEQLSSVEFVQNYLQLHFDGNILTLYSWPEIDTDSGKYNIGMPGYRDALCEMITHKIDRVSFVEQNHLHLFFDNGFQISLSLKRDELNLDLAEFAYFINIDKEWFAID